jgi:uncharacterized protein DUF5990
VLVEIVGVGCPVLPGVTVGVQRGAVVVDEYAADGSPLRWTFEATVRDSELRGPYVHGRPGSRFLYLSWQREPGGMFRRAKLMLDAVPSDALAAGTGLVATVGLAMPDGSPLCAAVRPPRIIWAAR